MLVGVYFGLRFPEGSYAICKVQNVCVCVFLISLCFPGGKVVVVGGGHALPDHIYIYIYMFAAREVGVHVAK